MQINDPSLAEKQVDPVDVSGQHSFNMDEDTLSPEAFIYRLNSDQRLRGQLTEEENMLDQAMLSLEDGEKCKNLILTSLLSIIKEDEMMRRVKVPQRSPIQKQVSNRKLKRIRYTKMQRMYKRNRKKSFDTLYNNNSTSDMLTPDIVFS